MFMTFNLPYSFCQTGWFQLAVWLLLALLQGSGHHCSALFLARSFSTWPGRDEDSKKKTQKLMAVLFQLATWNTLIITYITLRLGTSQILNSMFNRPKGKDSSSSLLHYLVSHNLRLEPIGARTYLVLLHFHGCQASFHLIDSKFQVVF